MTIKRSGRCSNRLGPRRGAATLDYALVMGIVLPFAALTFWAVPQILNWVYEMTCVLWGWPFP
ncbi:MAG TPA: hypothetical protein PLI18_02770 [Pirellulaceae bacterium]|nr:hypothetical protein [Pirellulaceae bacterium]